MELLRNVMLTTLFLLLIPWLIGKGAIRFLEKQEDFSIIFCVGWVIEWAAFEVISIPFALHKGSVTSLSLIFSIFLAFICAVVIIYLKKVKQNEKTQFQIDKNKETVIWLMISLVLIAFQIAFVSIYTHTDADDTYYLGTAITCLQADRIYSIDPYNGALYSGVSLNYIFSPFPLFWSVLAKLSGVHPAILAHTVAPIVFIPLSYMVCFQIGKMVFKKKQEAPYILIAIMSVFNIFGNTSVYTTSSFLLFRIWQGKSILCNIVLPFIFLIFLFVAENSVNNKIWSLLLLTECAGCLVSSMGVILATFSIAVWTIYSAIVKKEIKILFYGACCCLPGVLIGMAYIFMKF